MKTNIAIITILLLIGLSHPWKYLVSQSLVYKEKNGNEIFYYDYNYEKKKDQLIARNTKKAGSRIIEDQVLVLDKELKSRRWEYFRPKDNTRAVAEIKGNTVYLNGTHKGKEISKQFELDEYPWIQLFPLNSGLEKFITSSEESIRFWVIGTEGSADMKMTKYVASKKDEERVFIQNKDYLSIRVNITLAGWKSIFWDGDFFFRKKDGRIIKYDGDGPPGKSGSVTLLISEE